MCSKEYPPTTGPQKSCANCKEKYAKFCIKRWNSNHPERVREINNRLYEKYKLDPNWVKRQRVRKIAYVRLRKSLDPVYKKELWKRGKDTQKLKMTIVRQHAKCDNCGRGWPLECDHIDNNPHNHEINNLHWLCIKCHIDKHRNII